MTKNTDEMGKKDGFVFHTEWMEGMKGATREQQAEICLALVRYALYGEEPQTEDFAVQLAFQFVKMTIDEDKKKSEQARRAGQASARTRETAFQRRSNGVTNGVTSEEKEQENEKERSKEKDKEEDKEEEKENAFAKEKTSEKKGFVPPTLEEVRAYIGEKGYTHVNADMFWSFYESKGWTVGKERMKSWRGAVAYWESKHKEDDRRRQQERQQPKPWDTSAAARAYRMTHFAAERDPSVWERQQQIVDEIERNLKIKR